MVVTLDEITGHPELLSTPHSSVGSPAFSTDHFSDTSTPRANTRASSTTAHHSEKQTWQPVDNTINICRSSSSGSSKVGMPAHLRPPSINLGLPETNQQPDYHQSGTPLGSPCFGAGTPLGLWRSTVVDSFNSTLDDNFFDDILKSGQLFSPRGFMTPSSAALAAHVASTTGAPLSPKTAPPSLQLHTSPSSNSSNPVPSPAHSTGSVPIKQKLKATSPRYNPSQSSGFSPSGTESSSSSQRMPPPSSPLISRTEKAMNILLPLLHRHQSMVSSQFGEAHDRVPLQMLPYFKFLNEAAQRSSLPSTPHSHLSTSQIADESTH